MTESVPNEDPNANYTGWDLPEHPGLRAWIESLPPLCDEALYRVFLFTPEGEKSTYHLVAPFNDDEAYEEFDAMYLAAHNGAYGEDITEMSLWSPERPDYSRQKMVGYRIRRM